MNLSKSGKLFSEVWSNLAKNLRICEKIFSFYPVSQKKKNCQEQTNCDVEVPMVISKSMGNFVCLVKSQLKPFWNQFFVLQVNDTHSAAETSRNPAT